MRIQSVSTVLRVILIKLYIIYLQILMKILKSTISILVGKIQIFIKPHVNRGKQYRITIKHVVLV